MEIALKPEHERMLSDEVARGHAESVDQAVAEALELWRESKAAGLDKLRQAVQVGFDEIDRGEYTTLKSSDDYRAFAAEIVRRSKAAKDDDHGNSPG